jgi:DNA-binding HxlR family transcriptional regulator
MTVVPPCGCASPGAVDAATCYCGVENLLGIIRRRYSLAVMRAIHGRARARYHEVEEAVPEASTSTLAETLRALEDARLLERDVSGARPTYRLTASGTKLLKRLRGLLEDVQSTQP